MVLKVTKQEFRNLAINDNSFENSNNQIDTLKMVIRGDDNMEEGFNIIFDTLHQIACF